VNEKERPMDDPLAEHIIEGALEILRDPKRWTRHYSARDAEGRPCKVTAKRAARFCARGAVAKSAHRLGCDCIPVSVVDCLNSTGYVNVNDGPDSRRRVIAIFKKALKSLRA
jgi:hypothetical protein